MMSQGFLKSYRWLCILTFELIVLGGAVRVLNAGLACPDWPLCFGAYIPDFHPQVYLEFIHRVLAGLIGLGVLFLNGRLIFSKQSSRAVKWWSGLSFLLLGTQVVLGGLTVLLQLQSKVVTAHLALGTGLFANLLWIYFSLRPTQHQTDHTSMPTTLKWVAGSLATAVYGQILLGGTVATNYAALVCTDFPLCHGQWIPTLHGIIGLHVIHRLGAYTLFVGVLGYFAFVHFKKLQGEILRRAHQMAMLIFLQMCLGISNVIFYTPPIITILHLAVGTTLLAVGLRSFYLARSGIVEKAHEWVEAFG